MTSEAIWIWRYIARKSACVLCVFTVLPACIVRKYIEINLNLDNMNNENKVADLADG